MHSLGQISCQLPETREQESGPDNYIYKQEKLVNQEMREGCFFSPRNQESVSLWEQCFCSSLECL